MGAERCTPNASGRGTLRATLSFVLGGGRLSRADAAEVFGVALGPDTDPIALGALLIALAQRGETQPELAGAADAVRARMTPFEHPFPDALDACGTGGDGLGTFNLSTAAALVAAGAGARVVKHGNRAVSSRAGSSDVLEALGGVLDVGPPTALEALERGGFTYLHAPRYHASLALAAPVRRALGVPTLFNLLGPLCNPGRVTRQVVGVAAPRRVASMAAALTDLGARAGYVVHGAGGADELTLAGVNRVHAVGEATPLVVDGARLGLAFAPVSRLAGGDAEANARTMRALLAGRAVAIAEGAEAVFDATLLNAALALVAAGIAVDLPEGLERARCAIERGDAARALDTWVRISRAAGLAGAATGRAR